MKKLKYITLIVIFLIFSFHLLFSKELGVRIVDKELNGKELYTTLLIEGNFSYDTIDAIKNGITARVYITVQLLRSGGFLNFGQGTISEKRVYFTINYDVWDNNFVIKSKKLKSNIKTNNPAEIVRIIEKNINPLTLPLKSLSNKNKLIVRSKIEIQTIKLYPPFGIFLYFFDPWNYESKWKYSEPFSVKGIKKG